jgi:hypothetical protein
MITNTHKQMSHWLLAILTLQAIQIHAISIEKRAPPQSTPICIQSCSDGGNWVQVWDTFQGSLRCNGAAPGSCRWSSSLAACQALPQADTVNGVVCVNGPGIAGWCAEAVKQIWLFQSPSVCGGGYRCLQSCSDGGNYFSARVNAGKTQCLGTAGNNCIWYSDATCTKPFGNAAGVPGLSCDVAANDGWCGEANRVLLRGQTPTNCNGGSTWKCMQSCSDAGHYFSARNNNGRVQCVGTAQTNCIWYSDAACSKPFAPGTATPGLTCDPGATGGWCGEGNKQLLHNQPQTNCNGGTVPLPPPGYQCMQSCMDNLQYLLITKRSDGKAQCLGANANQCTWFMDPSCSVRADPGTLAPVIGQGVICEVTAQGGWCQAANGLINGQPTICPTPAPMPGWKCLSATGSCGNSYYLVNDFGQAGLQCSGALPYSGACVSFTDKFCWGTYSPPAIYASTKEPCAYSDQRPWCREAWRVFKTGGQPICS